MPRMKRISGLAAHVSADRRACCCAGRGSCRTRSDPGTNQSERIARAEVRRERREGKGAARDVREPAARRNHPAVVQRLHELSRDGGRDDAGVGLRVPPDARSADVRRADQPRHGRALFLLQSGGPAAGRAEAGRAESRRHHGKTGDRRRVEGIDRLLRSRPRCRNGGLAREDRAGPGRFIERTDSAACARTRSSTTPCTAPKTTERSRRICACRAWCPRRRRCIRPKR